jgi:two-component system, NarL family, response regulator DesR
VEPETKGILIVEDHRALQGGLVTILGLEPGIEVVGRLESVADTREFAARGEAFDVAVVDLFLPDGDGIQAMEDLRRANPRAKVLVLTSSVDPEDHARAEREGADAVLSKATPLKEIVEIIKRLG